MAPRPARIALVVVVLGALIAGTATVVSLAATQSEPKSQAQATPRPTPSATPTAVALDPAVQAQLDYVLTHWDSYNLSEYGELADTDCVNFANQSLIARGWAMDENWWTTGTDSEFSFSPAWVSSTAFLNYLTESGRAEALSDEQRDQVKVGDVVQFDWDNSGDRDHTGIVTRVTGTGDNIEIDYAGHTDDTDYRSVDWAITEHHPGGTAYYWSIP